MLKSLVVHLPKSLGFSSKWAFNLVKDGKGVATNYKGKQEKAAADNMQLLKVLFRCMNILFGHV